MRNFSRSPFPAGFLIGLLVFLGVLGLRHSGSLESTELTAYDGYIRLQPKISAAAPRILLIEITEKDIQTQVQWPLTDALLVRMLKILLPHNPRAIGLDIYRDMPVPPGHEDLEAILTNNPKIIATLKFGGDRETGVPPPSVLENTDQVGFNDLLVDPGGIVRRGLLFLDDGKTAHYSFALRLALLYLKAKGVGLQADPSNPQDIRLGKIILPPLGPNEGGYIGADDRGYQILLDYKDTPDSFPTFSLADLLADKVPPQEVKDRIVIIGTTAEGVKDFFFTPFSRGVDFSQQTSGIALHAQIVNQLIRFGLDEGSPLKSMKDWHEWVWILLWSFMGAGIGLGVRSPWKFSLFTLGGLVCLFFIVYLAFLIRWWIPLIPPAMAWAVSAAVDTAYMANREKKERASLMNLFSKHVSPEVAEIIWKQREQFIEGGRPRPQKLVETVMFTDLKGFTSLTERLDPQVLIDWLNTYLEAMAKLVMDHGGIIDEYTGDGFKADFGVPIAHTAETEISRDALNAVYCALAMEEELKRLNVIWQERDLPTANMRVGIFTGPVVAGSLGSSQRLKYTTIGDTVNIASRLESFDKDYRGPDHTDSPCRILIGETTLSHLGDQFQTIKVGEVNLKGKVQKIILHHVLGRIQGNPRRTEKGEAP